MNKTPDNTKLVEAMKQFKAVRTVIFQEEFYKAVIDATFYVPVTVDKNQSGDKKNGKLCALRTPDGKRYLSVFTSLDELRKSYGDRDDVMTMLQNFVTVRELVTRKNSGLDGFIIDEKGENVAIPKEEMLPKE